MIDTTSWPQNPFLRRRVAVGYMRKGEMAAIARTLGKSRSYITRALATGESEDVTILAAKALGVQPQVAFPRQYDADGQHISRAIKSA
jgi:lambda repressor-like predicted transcriptional regulator